MPTHPADLREGDYLRAVSIQEAKIRREFSVPSEEFRTG